jgi:hypothetical protein
MADQGGQIRWRDKFFGCFSNHPQPKPRDDVAKPHKVAPPAPTTSEPLQSTTAFGPDSKVSQSRASVSQSLRCPRVANPTAGNTDGAAGANDSTGGRNQKCLENGLERDLTKEAFYALPAETQEEVRKLIPNAGSDVVEFSTSVTDEIRSLIGIVEIKEEECEKKFWKINIAGNDIVIKDYVKSTLNVLQQVGDIAINFAPAPGSIVWSGVKTIMQVSGIICQANIESREKCVIL